LRFKTPSRWFHKLDRGNSLDVKLCTQYLVLFVVTIDSSKGKYPHHMFRCFHILWNKLLAVTTSTSVSLTDIREANHGAKNLTMLACFELRIFSLNEFGSSSGTGPADLKRDNTGAVKYKNDRRIAGVKMAMIEQEMQTPPPKGIGIRQSTRFTFHHQTLGSFKIFSTGAIIIDEMRSAIRSTFEKFTLNFCVSPLSSKFLWLSLVN